MHLFCGKCNQSFSRNVFSSLKRKRYHDDTYQLHSDLVLQRNPKKMPVSIRRQANGEIPPSSIPFICRYKCRSLPLSGIIIRMTSCFSSAIWISFPIIWNDYSRSYGLRLLPCLYLCIPPKGWYGAWRNQFYLYDILRYMEKRMQADDTLLICDADCLCMRPLEQLFSDTRKYGSALYDASDRPDLSVNGITLKEMTDIYNDCYVEKRREKKRRRQRRKQKRKRKKQSSKIRKTESQEQSLSIITGRIYLAAW